MQLYGAVTSLECLYLSVPIKGMTAFSKYAKCCQTTPNLLHKMPKSRFLCKPLSFNLFFWLFFSPRMTMKHIISLNEKKMLFNSQIKDFKKGFLHSFLNLQGLNTTQPKIVYIVCIKLLFKISKCWPLSVLVLTLFILLHWTRLTFSVCSTFFSLVLAYFLNTAAQRDIFMQICLNQYNYVSFKCILFKGPGMI